MTIRVIHHLEDDCWWAESPDVPGWTAVGATFAEIRKLAEEGVRFALEQDDVELRHLIPAELLPYLQTTVGGIATLQVQQPAPLAVATTAPIAGVSEDFSPV